MEWETLEAILLAVQPFTSQGDSLIVGVKKTLRSNTGFWEWILEPWWIASGKELIRDEGSQGREQDWKNRATLLLISQLVTHIVPNNMFLFRTQSPVGFSSLLCLHLWQLCTVQTGQRERHFSVCQSPSAGMHMQSQPAHVSPCKGSAFERY